MTLSNWKIVCRFMYCVVWLLTDSSTLHTHLVKETLATLKGEYTE